MRMHLRVLHLLLRGIRRRRWVAWGPRYWYSRLPLWRIGAATFTLKDVPALLLTLILMCMSI